MTQPRPIPAPTDAAQTGIAPSLPRAFDLMLTPPDEAEAQALARALAALSDHVARRAGQTMTRWQPLISDPDFQASARNLAEWLALRGADLTPLQPALSRFGLSSLGRAEGHVAGSLAAVQAALAPIAGVAQTVAFPPAADLGAGRARLAARRDRLFGAGGAGGPATRIMVTLPPEAATDPTLIPALAEAGADLFRLNAAHDGPQEWAAMVAHLGRAEVALGRKLPLSVDLPGPKFRLAQVSRRAEKERLHKGDRFALVRDLDAAPKGVVAATLSHAALFDALRPGAHLVLDDGKLVAEVEGVVDGYALFRVLSAPEKGFKVKPARGVNLPGADLNLPAISADDAEALDFAARHADLVALSFAQVPQDVADLHSALDARGCGPIDRPGVVLKIETPQGLANLPDLVVAAGGQGPVAVMIARGDLAVEVGFPRLSEIQEEILWLCEAAQVPVIWATQVLEGMVKTGQASRAEVTDAAMAQRAECVMLNKGEYVAPAVAFLRDILTRMDRHQDKKSARMVPLGLWGLKA